MRDLESIPTVPVARFVLLVLVLTACGSTSPFEQEKFDGEVALLHIERQVSFGPRPPGSEAHGQTVDYIHDTLTENGWKVSDQTFEFDGLEGKNILGEAGPEGGRWVILGAHYDTRPIADQDQFSPTTPVMGANDGASGVAVLLELARVLKPSNLDIRVWLVFFDAEDSGGIDERAWAFGARKFAENLEEYPDAVVVVDMIGDSDLNIYFERNSDPVLSAEIWDLAQTLGYSGFIRELRYAMIDDHLPFVQMGIPAIDIIDFDYPYWHTTEDTLDKVSAESLEQVGRTLQVWVTENQPLANPDE